MQYRYFIVDVFSDQQFGGNPLAVLPEASGLTAGQMQQIAREFNFSESTFVLPPPPDSDSDFEVRIFTPTREVPFAGHPNVGTAFALAQDGVFGEIDTAREIIFSEQAGDVPVRIVPVQDGGFWCELRAPQPLQIGPPVDAALLAGILSLDLADIRVDRHPPRNASVGLEFLMVELTSVDALARARLNGALLEDAAGDGLCPDIHCYVRDGQTIDARMFAPLDGVPEDPATGSANCALVALLTTLAAEDGEYTWQITQGVIMGRPSRLDARTQKHAGEVTGVWIGGQSVLFAEGSLSLTI